MKLSELSVELSKRGFPAQVDGEDIDVRAVNTLDSAGAGELSFLSNKKYVSALSKTKAAAVIVAEDMQVRKGLSAIRCADPYAGVTVAIVVLHGYRKHPKWGVSGKAAVHVTASLGESPNIAEFVSIAADAKIGKNVTMYPGCYVGERVKMGDDCVLFPNVVVYDDCVLGDRVTVHAGTVIGQDGLGYAPVGEKWIKIPQVGRTIIGDDVELGANCAVDRATLGETSIGDGTKFGNVMVIGHGAKIGPDCMFVGLVGVAGSAKIGRHVTIGGHSAVNGHITVGDNVSAGGMTGLMQNVRDGEKVFGIPAVPVEKALRNAATAVDLGDYAKRIKQLERELAKLRDQLNRQGEVDSTSDQE